MDQRLFDPKTQRELAECLVSDNAISRMAARRTLEKNGFDASAAVAAAKAWKASGAPFVPVPPPASALSLKSAPHLTGDTVKNLMLKLASGSPIDRLEGKRYCQANGVSVDELKALARNIAGPAPNSGP